MTKNASICLKKTPHLEPAPIYIDHSITMTIENILGFRHGRTRGNAEHILFSVADWNRMIIASK